MQQKWQVWTQLTERNLAYTWGYAFDTINARMCTRFIRYNLMSEWTALLKQRNTQTIFRRSHIRFLEYGITL